MSTAQLYPLIPLRPENPDLTEFLKFWLKLPIGFLKSLPPSESQKNLLIAHESVVTLVLYREAPFQVELVIMVPNSPAWPGEHRHPNVDSYEVAVFNAVNFTKNGELQNGPELVIRHKTPFVPDVFVDSYCVRLLPTDWHGTSQLKDGGALISVQKWLNNVPPSSVGLDWIGAPTTPGHAEILKQQGNSAHCSSDIGDAE